MTHFLIFLAVLTAVLFGLPILLDRKKTAKETTDKPSPRSMQPFIMKLVGGPADGHVEKIVEQERPVFFVATYPPKIDESTGMPPEENVVGHMYGKMYVRPNYAYYRYVLDDEYVYVRDLDEKEVQSIAITGEQPQVQPPRGYDGNEED